MRALVVLAVLLVAGCVEAPDLDGAGDRGARLGYLDTQMRLVDAPEPSMGAVRSGSFFQAWAEGADYPTWLAPASERDVVVDELDLIVYLRVTGPVAETVRFPDVMAYVGAGGAWMGYGNATTPAVLLPGETYRLDLEIGVPEGGLWVPAGEQLGVKVVPVMHQNAQADIEVLVGGETPSVLTWSQRETAAPIGEARRDQARGEVVGSAYAGPAAPPTTRARHTVEVPAAPGMLVAWMNATAATGIPDIDLEIVSPNGTVVAFSGTPTPREMIRLGPANLASPGTYTLVVASYGSARAEYELAWHVAPLAS